MEPGIWRSCVDYLKERLDCLCENGGEARFRYDVSLSAVKKQFTRRSGHPAGGGHSGGAGRRWAAVLSV